MKIHLFQQCLIDMFYPHVGMAGVEVLERLGCELVVPKKQVCCGQMFTNSGYNDAAMDAINALEDNFNCYVTVQEREAIQAKAEELQKKIDDGTLTGPLAGVPVAVKDNMCTKGTRTTCSSKILENFEPTYTAEAVLNLEKAGALIIGKTNMDEFAMGSTTETSHYGVTKNPWNAEHVQVVQQRQVQQESVAMR